MATKKTPGNSKGAGTMGWSSNTRGGVGNGANDSSEKERDNVPWSLLITVLAVLLTFFIVMPVLGFMYMDMYNATNAAVHEVKKMKELRLQILIERTKE